MRGRPAGSKNKSAQFKHYQPKRWLPWMDALVLASLTNENRETLAEQFGITETHVGNILNTEKAQEVRGVIRKRLLEGNSSLEEKLSRIRELSINNMVRFLESDQARNANHFAFMDRSLAAFKLTGVGEPEKKESGAVISHSNVIIAAGNEINDRIAKGLELSNEIKQRALPEGDPGEKVSRGLKLFKEA